MAKFYEDIHGAEQPVNQPDLAIAPGS